MKLSYLVVDDRNQLRRVSHATVSKLWNGTCTSQDLGLRSTHELRLVSVVLDDRLLPTKVYLLRVPLTHGVFTLANRLTLQLFAMPDCVTDQEREAHHGVGWPEDLARQLAIVLDIPLRDLAGTFDVGGPLFVAAARSVSPQKALRFLR